MTDAMANLDSDLRYSVNGYRGIAWYLVGPEMVDTEETWWDGCQEPTGNVVCVMVGDDRRFTFNPSELTPLADEDYCSECGQIGCTADGR